jgi:RNA polymerase sigma factor (sigma-70 family)
MASTGRTDAELVGDSLAGNRDAFSEIVGRYQTLICSLAYSSTGDLARSEDLAQDTFLAAWRQLGELREPEKLRAWVCAIARNRIHDSFRKHNREPIFKAETLDCAGEATAIEPQPSDHAVSQDETAIMWRALEQIPEIYREPLILFHRENQSIERVAAALDLSEDNVRQRLVRGRKLLQAEVEAVVEGALKNTAPRRKFTTSVMDALPGAAAVSKAAGGIAGGAATATGAIGHGTGLFLTLITTSPITPLLMLFLARKLGRPTDANAPSAEELELRKRYAREFAGLVLAAIVAVELSAVWFKHLGRPPWFAPFLPLGAIISLLVVCIVRDRQTEERIRQIQGQIEMIPAKAKWEFCSRQRLLNIPVLRIRFLVAADPVKAWIAVGHVAQGVIFGCGTVAMGPFSVGVLGIGMFSVGILALGSWAFGAIAAGVRASGLYAFGLRAAYGLAAYARDFAGSPSGQNRSMVYALHANDAVAKSYFDQSRFFSWTTSWLHDFRFLLLGLGVAYLLVWMVWLYVRLRRRSSS